MTQVEIYQNQWVIDKKTWHFIYGLIFKNKLSKMRGLGHIDKILL